MTELIGMRADYQHEFEQKQQGQRSDRAIVFEHYRTRLFGVAYRMLGSVEDAKDLIQETYLRWHHADAATVRSPEAWLVAVTTRLSIDRLRRASFERESYVGDWLPEPIATDGPSAPDRSTELASDLSMAFLVLLERLAPEERAAFLLRDVLGADYGEATVVTFVDDRLIATTSIETDAEGERVIAFFRVINPEKLRHAIECPH